MKKHLAVILALVLIIGTMGTIGVSADVQTENIKNYVKDGTFDVWGTKGDKGAYAVYDESAAISAEADYAGNGYGIKFKKESGNARGAVWQEITPVPYVPLKATVQIRINELTLGEMEQGVRLIARYGSLYSGTALATTAFENTVSNEWKTLTISFMPTTAEPFLIGITTGVDLTSFDIDVDNLVLQAVEPEIPNADFEAVTDGKFDAWVDRSAQDDSVVVTEEGRGNVLKLTKTGYLAQKINNLKPGTKYRFSFDIKSTAAVGLVKAQGCGSQAGGDPTYGNINTNGEWKRYSIEGITGTSVKTGETSINLDIYLRHNGATGEVYYDNVTIEEIEQNGNLITNSSFECGPDGMGGTWSVSHGSAALDTAAFAEKNALRLYGTGTGERRLNYSPLVPVGTEGTIYEFSCKAKLNEAVADTSTAYIQLHLYRGKAGESGLEWEASAVRKDTKLTELPVGKWTELSHMIKMPTGYTAFGYIRVRLIGGGDVSLDDVVLRPAAESKVMFRKADAEYTDTFSATLDNVRVNAITDAGKSVTACAGVYRQEGNAVVMVSVSEIATATADGDGLANLNFELEAPTDLSDGDYFVKVFVLDSLHGLKALRAATLLGESASA